MNEIGLLAKIKQQMERFSPAEKKIAAYILDHAELVPNMTTKDLAQAADTSEASVVCFASFVATEEKSSWPDDGKHLTCFARGQHHDLEGWRLNRKRSVVPRFKLRTFYKTSLFFAFAQPPAYI